MQGSVDNDMQVNARFNWRWSDALVSKTQFSLGTGNQDMAHLESEYTGSDFTTSIKALNPSFFEGGLTGIFMGSYMQSVTKKLALGMEGVWQRAALSQPPDTVMSYVAKYKSDDWIATGQLAGAGALSTTFWRKISEKCQAGIEMTLSLAPGDPAGGMMMGGPSIQAEGVTTAAVKYDFRMSTLRMQVDTKGKMTCLAEKRIAPAIMMTIAAEVDHPTVCPLSNPYLLKDEMLTFTQGAAKLGLGVSLESGGEELQERQEALGAAAPSPNIPF